MLTFEVYESDVREDELEEGEIDHEVKTTFVWSNQVLLYLFIWHSVLN